MKRRRNDAPVIPRPVSVTDEGARRAGLDLAVVKSHELHAKERFTIGQFQSHPVLPSCDVRIKRDENNCGGNERRREILNSKPGPLFDVRNYHDIKQGEKFTQNRHVRDKKGGYRRTRMRQKCSKKLFEILESTVFDHIACRKMKKGEGFIRRYLRRIS